jgi:2,3-bisphosphoglycerate-independent phosphoglycerate mutase
MTTGQAHTAHTCELVPFAYVGRKAKIQRRWCVVGCCAYFINAFMGLPIPSEMTGKVLVEFQ